MKETSTVVSFKKLLTTVPLISQSQTPWGPTEHRGGGSFERGDTGPDTRWGHAPEQILSQSLSTDSFVLEKNNFSVSENHVRLTHFTSLWLVSYFRIGESPSDTAGEEGRGRSVEFAAGDFAPCYRFNRIISVMLLFPIQRHLTVWIEL